MPKRLARILKPSRRSTWWLDAIGLLIFGPWLLTPLAAISTHEGPFLPIHPNPNTYNCGGPGFTDYGCTGGSEAIIGNVIGTVFMLALLGVCIILVVRLVNREKGAKADD